MKKFCLLALFLTFAACNDAGTGFNGDSTTVVVISAIDTAVSTDADVDVVVTFSVTQTDSASGERVPANGIQITASCNNCEFKDSATGPRLPETTDVSTYATVGTLYQFKSGDNGTYTLLVRLKAPGNVNATEYKATIAALAGIVQTSTTITVTSLTGG